MKLFTFLLFTFFYSTASYTTKQLSVIYPHSWEKYSSWKLAYTKNYIEEEDVQKFYIFKANDDYIQKINNSSVSFHLAHNIYSDMTHAEFLKHFNLDSNKSQSFNFSYEKRNLRKGNISYLNSFDWTTQGVVTPVKNQGICGSCWAFATASALEVQYAVKNKVVIPFSVQEYLDCTYTLNGCSGGWADDALRFDIEKEGHVTEDDYPYISGSTGVSNQCNLQNLQNIPNSKIETFVYLGTDYRQGGSKQAEIDYKNAINNVGPVIVNFDASDKIFQFYSGGIIDQCTTKYGTLNHAVATVGYGNENGKSFFKFKNSWGQSWGEKGYFRMQSTLDPNHPEYTIGLCSIMKNALYPVL